jgi:NADPH-dependent curcumin reductase
MPGYALMARRSVRDVDTHAIPEKTQMLVLARRPGNDIRDGDFALLNRPIDAPKRGQVVIHNHVTSVDPYQIRMMRGGEGHSDQQIGEAIHAGSVGVVMVSEDPKAPVGTQVATYSGWTEYATWTLADSEIAERRLGDELDWIHVLGTPGVTAYVGIHDVGRVAAGNTVVVSGAAGAIGGVAVQLAKAAGARVIAIAGGPDRVAHTTGVLGADVGLDHRALDFTDQLRGVLADGADLFFDNVGGPLLPPMIDLLAPRGRAVISGAVSSYAGEHDYELTLDVSQMMSNRLSIEAFNVGDYYSTRLTPIREELSAMLRSGQISNIVSEFEGLTSAPSALRTVFRSATGCVGKRVVRIA